MNSTSTLPEPANAAHSVPLRMPAWARVAKRVEVALLLVAAVFFALHFVHLRADFPNHSLWMDWAKYTDEGWYGDAAIRHYQLGHWYVPGDFNPAAALPIWPLIEMALFRVTGVSLVAARALTVVVFGLCLVFCYWLIRLWSPMRTLGGEDALESRAYSLAPAIAVLLLAVNPFCFVFMRLAILEPLLILLTLLALLTASTAGAVQWSGGSWREILQRKQNVRPAAWAAALGLLLVTVVLTKTTGIFLFSAVFWLLWASCGYRVKPFLRVAAVTCGVGAAAWGGYYGLFVRRHYLVDYRYLFSANAYTGATLATLPTVLHDTLFDGTWIGMTLFALAMAAVVGLLVVLGRTRFRGSPLGASLLLWVLGYATFLAYHDNLQPRYYLVIAVPLTMLVAIAFDAVLGVAVREGVRWNGLGFAPLVRMTAALGGVALVFAIVNGARQTISFVGHPEYTFLSAANQIHDVVERESAAHPGHSRLVLSISGADLSLMTGLPSICDDFGTSTLPERVARDKPGWFATWNEVDDDKMEALAPMYRLVRVTAVPAFDDPERNLLILYRLDPLSSPERPRGRGRRRYLSVPPRLRTPIGAQPSAKQ
jgi:hypothetical protein